MGEEKKDFPAARLATITATRWTGNKLFSKGGLTEHSASSRVLRRGQRERWAAIEFEQITQGENNMRSPHGHEPREPNC